MKDDFIDEDMVGYKPKIKKWISPSGNKCCIRKANMWHVCEKCDGDIAKGEKYLEVTGLGECGFWTVRICGFCRNL